MKQKELVVGVAYGLVVGVVAGAVAALLLAPASGTETRRRLRFEREHAVEAARRQVRRTRARLHLTQPNEEVEEEEEGAFSGA